MSDNLVKILDKFTGFGSYYFFLGGPLIGLFFIHYTYKLFIFWFVCHYIMVIGVNIAYHRYFSHRSFYANRIMQFFIALWGAASLQRGPLWWASSHRMHHRFCETDNDPHTPNKGFYYSHFGWTMDYRKIHWDYIPDFAKYRELHLVEYAYWFFTPVFSYLLYKFGNLDYMLVYHIAITTSLNAEAFVNSLCHKRNAQKCEALDKYWIGLLTAGDGFHRYHHLNPRCAKHSNKWYQLDFTYMIICFLESIKLIKNVQHPGIRGMTCEIDQR